MPKIAWVSGYVLCLAATTLASTPIEAADLVCMAAVSATGSGPGKSGAETLAKNSWTNAAKRAWKAPVGAPQDVPSPPFSWEGAKNPAMSCKSRTIGFECTATGEPCYDPTPYQPQR
jgi:hypothetical protein